MEATPKNVTLRTLSIIILLFCFCMQNATKKQLLPMTKCRNVPTGRTVTPTRSQETQQRAVDVVAVSFSLHHKMNHPEVAALNEERAARRRQGQLLHRCYVVMQNLDDSQKIRSKK